MQRDTIFFDLDGTLLYMDQDRHVEAFFNLLYENACDKTREYILDKKTMNKSFGFMMSEDHKDMTNSEALLYSLYKHTNLSKGVWDEYFERLYDKHYERLKCTIEKVKTTNEVLSTAVNKGYDLILATNPVFHSSGTLDRLKWADIDPGCFSYISYVDEMHYCKPSLKYYQEVLDRVNKSADRCYMVGNSVSEDMSAVELGFSGYLVTDCLLGNLEEAPECEIGTYLDLLEWVEKLPSV